MPVYEYYCDNCKEKMEIEQRITEQPIKVCPKCNSSRFKRLISVTNFILKGSGWYKTDYTDLGKKRKEENKANEDENKVDKNS